MDALLTRKKDVWQRYLLPVIFMLGDYIAVVMAINCGVVLRNSFDIFHHSIYSVPPAYTYLWVPLFFIIFLKLMHTYRMMQPFIYLVRCVFYAVLNGVIASITVLFLLNLAESTSRAFVIIFSVLALLFIYIERIILLYIVKCARLFREPVLLIGAGLTAERMIAFFDGDLGYHYEIIGIIDDSPISKKVADKYRYLGAFDQAEKIVRRVGVSTVIIAAPGLERDRLSALIALLQPHVRNIAFVPDLIGTPMVDVSVDVLFSEKMLLLHLRNNLSRMGNKFIKRMFDIVMTLVGGILISPFLIIVAVLVAIDNRGNVIFAHRRIGRGGKEFSCYKFQTMVSDADERLNEYLANNPSARKEWEETYKLTDDPRVTKLGAFLRRTSIDELPQLWNVLTGDMSLVGPRPIVREEIKKYGENIREYYMVRPGITGMWQTGGRSDTTYEERVAMDTWYVRNWSVWIDLMFLARTFAVVIKGKGAY